MKANKLVEAFVVVNSTPQMQVEAFLRNADDTEKCIIDLAVTVFRLPKKERSFGQLKKELARMFVSKLGLWGTLSAIFAGLRDESGPMEGAKKSVIHKACLKMGYLNPVSSCAL
jgi:hypothetical protein